MNDAPNRPRPAKATAILQSLAARPALLALITVVLWLIAATVYCHTHGYVDLDQGRPDWGFSIGWALRHWGAWLILGPLLAWGNAASPGMGRRILLAATALITAAVVSLLLDALVGEPNPNLAAALYWHLPQSGALLGILLAVEAIRGFRNRTPQASASLPTLELDCEGGSVLINPDQIRWIAAAGNYVEISDGRRVGRLRSTLNEFAARLDAERFHRVHRSFIVNLGFVERIERLADSRRDVLRLSGCDRLIPISRQGVARLRRRFQAAP